MSVLFRAKDKFAVSQVKLNYEVCLSFLDNIFLSLTAVTLILVALPVYVTTVSSQVDPQTSTADAGSCGPTYSDFYSFINLPNSDGAVFGRFTRTLLADPKELSLYNSDDLLNSDLINCSLGVNKSLLVSLVPVSYGLSQYSLNINLVGTGDNQTCTKVIHNGTSIIFGISVSQPDPSTFDFLVAGGYFWYVGQYKDLGGASINMSGTNVNGLLFAMIDPSVYGPSLQYPAIPFPCNLTILLSGGVNSPAGALSLLTSALVACILMTHLLRWGREFSHNQAQTSVIS